MNYSLSYSLNFYFRDGGLRQSRTPCSTVLNKDSIVTLGGYLDISGGNKDIIVGTKMELPVWLARSLSSSRKHIVSTQLPQTYRDKYREIMRADANVLDLHKLGPNFYELGQHLLPLAGPEADQLAQTLSGTLRDRLRHIMDTAQNSLADDAASHVRKLDELERGLFKAGQKALKEHQLWLSRRAHILTTSDMVDKHNKRKHEEMMGHC
ncbi:unnamed protein product, partial [Meganyctiphanes norvegica]